MECRGCGGFREWELMCTGRSESGVVGSGKINADAECGKSERVGGGS